MRVDFTMLPPPSAWLLQARAGGAPPGGSPVEVFVGGCVFALGGQQWLCFAGDAFDEGRLDGFRAGMKLTRVTDVSDAYVAIRVDGPDAGSVLAADCGAPAFLQAAVVGASAATRVGQVQVFVDRDSSTSFRIHVDRSYADYLLEWLRAQAGRR